MNTVEFEALLQRFSGAAERGDGPAFAECFTPDGVYHDYIYGDHTGRADIAHMMSDLLKQFKGDEAKAIAAYNWGSGNVTNKGMDRLPDATIKYLKDMSLKVPEQRQEYSQNNSRYMGSNVASGQNQATNNSNSEVNIQNMNIQTQATDSDGIVEGMKISMQNNSLINLGMVGNR